MYNLSITAPQPLTVQSFNGSELANRYIEYLDTTEATITTYKRALKQFILYLADNQITEPTRSTILAYKQALKEAHKAAATITIYILAVRKFFEWLEQEGIYPNVAKNVKGVTVDKDTFGKDALAPSQVIDIVSAINTDTPAGKRDYALLMLLTVCALRTIEVMRADIADLRTNVDGTILYVQGKGYADKGKYVKVPDGLAKALREYLATRPQAKPEEPLFTSISNNSKGERISTRTIRGLVKRYMIAAGYNSDKLTAHSLRHTGITTARRAGISLDEAQTYARHKSIATTRIYDHTADMSNNKCAQSVYDVIFGNM